MESKTILINSLISVIFSLGSLNIDTSEIPLLFGTQVFILLTLVSIVFYINKRITERLEVDRFYAKMREESDINTLVNQLVDSYSKAKEKNDFLKDHFIENMKLKISEIKNDIETDTIIDGTANGLMKLYDIHKGNFYIISQNKVCAELWQKELGKRIIAKNIELANKTNFIGQPINFLERVFVEDDNEDCNTVMKEIMDRHIESKIKSYKVKGETIRDFDFSDVVIFDNYAVCTSIIKQAKGPTEYKISFNPSEINKYRALFFKIRSESNSLIENG